MDFDFSQDQEQLRDAVRKWVDRAYSFDRRREITRAGGFDRATYGQLAELGLAGLYVSEGDGGMGMGPVEGMVVMEELGRGMVHEPVAQALIAGIAPFEALRAEEQSGANVSVVKAALALVGEDVGAARAPAAWPLPPGSAAALRTLLDAWGLRRSD